MSEMIIDEDGKMTIILSHQRRPLVCLGKENWKEKQIKLTRMVKYLTKKEKSPKNN